ncbi:MAG: aldo/keto reductase, partial [Chitinophagales bacterium]|nr:aldo/keto reductase [Chitinophagales bacterium]
EKLLYDNEKMNKVRELKALADKYQISLTHLSLAWCLKNPNVSTVILGASKPEQLKENLECLRIVPLLSQDIMNEIENILQNKPQIQEY